MDPGDVRPDLAAKLRPPHPGALACKTCGGVAEPIGVLDFNRSCAEVGGVHLPPSDVFIQYRQCARCGLVFTDAFDDWAPEDFAAHIYNDAYAAVDPDYAARRPDSMAGSVIQAFAPVREQLSILDYGGGNGRFAEQLRASGFDCETYDPFTQRFAARPARRFDLVTCFETLEHMPDPAAGVEDILALTADDGAVHFSTLTQPPDFARIGLAWWYIRPRNGHVTIYTRQALGWLWGRFGLGVGSFSDNLHIAVRGDGPAFTRHLMGGPAPP